MQRLGAERDLAQALGVSRSTVRQALAALEAAGVVRRVPGRGGGTFVRQQKVERDLSQVVGVPALLRAQGMTAGLADRQHRPGRGRRGDRGGPRRWRPGAYVIDVVRIRLADGTPISLEHVRLPAERFPGLLDLPLGGSLYELLEEHYDTVPGEAVEHIEVASAGGGRGRDPRRRRRAPRCSRSPGPPRTPTGASSSTPTTCSAPTAR